MTRAAVLAPVFRLPDPIDVAGQPQVVFGMRFDLLHDVLVDGLKSAAGAEPLVPTVFDRTVCSLIDLIVETSQTVQEEGSPPPPLITVDLPYRTVHDVLSTQLYQWSEGQPLHKEEFPQIAQSMTAGLLDILGTAPAGEAGRPV